MEATLHNLKLTSELEKLKETNPNTQRKIKEIAEKRNSNTFNRGIIKKWPKDNKYKTPEKILIDVDVQTFK